MTVLAMDRNNDAARRGVEHIVGEYVSRAREATAAGRLDEAKEDLRQARFVLDDMEVRDWPRATYDALFAEYREADRLLAAAR
jgi:hypothetical protein